LQRVLKFIKQLNNAKNVQKHIEIERIIHRIRLTIGGYFLYNKSSLKLGKFGKNKVKNF